MEKLVENGLEFTRYNCLEGYVDYTRLNAGHDPNKKKPFSTLNLIVNWLRFKGHPWELYDTKRVREMLSNKDGFTSEELYFLIDNR